MTVEGIIIVTQIPVVPPSRPVNVNMYLSENTRLNTKRAHSKHVS